ncbi:MAG: type I-MYXAN CRISPR-associated protein Cmx8 [Spirulinaceae cyanobacterium SM2_1_0]|nr:type I-MYXAN CRISPR-associated protein Cmx8 [Spirulinaceae cyanobacterium SM2_1_0]
MTEQLELHYELAELPSAQHRAGLAGLALLVDYLRDEPWFEERQDRDGAEIELEVEDYAATLRCNLEGLVALFDLTYAAQPDRRSRVQKPKKFENTEEVEVTDKKGNTKTITRYVYWTEIPKGAFLPELDPSHENGSGVWIKLWREMLWQIVRGVPATRKPYQNRVAPRDRSYETIRFSSDTEKIWQELTKPDKPVNQSGNYYLGAMAKTAENVPTRDRARYQFILHFWPFVTQVYCPAVLDKDGKREFRGYALAVPDVANLFEFCDLFRSVLQDRAVESYDYRPREAVIDLPEEGGLDVLRLLRDRVQRESGDLQWHEYLLGVELIHAEKVGNSGVKLRSTGYVEPINSQVDRYSQIREDYWCPWFRKQRLINLLSSNNPSIKPWSGFDALLSRIPRAWLQDPYFSHDARTLFQKEINMTTQSTSQTSKKIRSYAEIIYQVCQAYVLSKLDSKYDLRWKKCAGNPKLESDFNTKKAKIANEAFLAVRARTEKQAFIDYFVSTLYPHIRQSEFAEFATDLFDKTDEIRALTLLGLSSQYPLKPKEVLKDGAVTSS